MEHRVGFIGFGGMGGGYHYDVAADRPDVGDYKPVAAYDVQEEQRKIAAEKGLKVYDNLEDFLASDEFDIVVVATPNQYHCDLTCRALKAGKHVICEKPAAMSPEEFQLMMDTAKETGKLLCVHQNRRTDRDFKIAKEIIEKGMIGTPYMVEANIVDNCNGYMFGWRSHPDQGGGMLLDWGVHVLDQILYLIQEPIKSVYATVRNINGCLVDSYSKIIMTFESGLVAQMVASRCPHTPNMPKWSVSGDKGAFSIDRTCGPKAEVTRMINERYETRDELVYEGNGVPVIRPTQYLEADYETFTYPPEGQEVVQDWAELYKNMLNAIDGKEELIVKPEQVLRVLKVIEAAFESSKTGKSVQF